MLSGNLNLACTVVTYLEESTSIQGICCPVTMMTSHKFFLASTSGLKEFSKAPELTSRIYISLGQWITLISSVYTIRAINASKLVTTYYGFHQGFSVSG